MYLDPPGRKYIENHEDYGNMNLTSKLTQINHEE